MWRFFATFPYLVIAQLPAYDPEGGVEEVVVDVHLGQAVARPRRHPLLVQVVVDHHLRTRRSDALLGTLVTAKNRKKNKFLKFVWGKVGRF